MTIPDGHPGVNETGQNPSEAPQRFEAAARLERCIPQILARWTERVRAEIPAASGRDDPILLDHVPQFLRDLARVLAGEATLEGIRVYPGSPGEHGEQRARMPGYSLADVFAEYSLLRQVVMDLLEAPAPLPVDAGKALQTGIDRAIREAAIHYVETTHSELQSREQRLRRLQALSDVALSSLSLDELLRELLDRIRRMLAADTAAILLEREGVLVVRAASGLEEEAEQGFYVRLGEGFAGRVAATGQPLLIPDAAQIEIVSPILRERVRSLLGVPLRVEGTVTGVLHVGAREIGRFTEEDRCFLELAADRAALAIDRARLLQELRATGQRKDEFLAMLAHELRTPLSAVSHATYILEQIALDARALRQLATIQRQTSHLARLAEDLIDLTRVSSGRIEMRQEPVELGAIAIEAAEVVRPFVDARGQELTCCIASEPLRLDGDPIRLQQVLANLLNNAVKYTEPGGRIWLTVERQEDRAVVRVRDTGIGIDAAVLPTLFDLFTQVDPTDAQSHRGLGVGLHLVKRLVELHGGTVTAHSEGPGRGAEFTVSLPLDGSGDCEEALASMRAPQAAGQPPVS